MQREVRSGVSFNALPLIDDLAFCWPNQGLHWMLDPAVPSPPWGSRHGDTQVRLKTMLVPSAAQTQELFFLKTQHVGFWGLTAPANPPTSGKPFIESLSFTNISCLPHSYPQEKQSQCVQMTSRAPPPLPAWPAALCPCSCPSLWGAHPEILLLHARDLFYVVFLQQLFPI